MSSAIELLSRLPLSACRELKFHLRHSWSSCGIVVSFTFSLPFLVSSLERTLKLHSCAASLLRDNLDVGDFYALCDPVNLRQVPAEAPLSVCYFVALLSTVTVVDLLLLCLCDRYSDLQSDFVYIWITESRKIISRSYRSRDSTRTSASVRSFCKCHIIEFGEAQHI